MPHFRFHLHQGEDIVIDDEGLELGDLACAAQYAQRTALELMAWSIREAAELRLDGEIRIADAAGNLLQSLPFASALTIVRPNV